MGVSGPQHYNRRYGLASGLVGHGSATPGCSTVSANNVDTSIFVMPLDLAAMQLAYVATAPAGSGLPWIAETKIEPFVGLSQLPHELSIDKYEKYCLGLLTELQLRQPRNAPVNLSVWFQSAMRQSADKGELWNLPACFRRIDIRLSIDLMESLKQDTLLYNPLQKLSTKCLLAGIHVPSRLIMTIIAQASSKPERLVQDALSRS